MKPKRVGELVICGAKVGIYLENNLYDEATSCSGLYDPAASTIYIDDANGEEMVRHILIHEVGHALLHLSGAMYELEQDLKPDVDVERVEERLVRTLTPHIVALVNVKHLARKTR